MQPAHSANRHCLSSQQQHRCNTCKMVLPAIFTKKCHDLMSQYVVRATNELLEFFSEELAMHQSLSEVPLNLTTRNDLHQQSTVDPAVISTEISNTLVNNNLTALNLSNNQTTSDSIVTPNETSSSLATEQTKSDTLAVRLPNIVKTETQNVLQSTDLVNHSNANSADCQASINQNNTSPASESQQQLTNPNKVSETVISPNLTSQKKSTSNISNVNTNSTFVSVKVELSDASVETPILTTPPAEEPVIRSSLDSTAENELLSFEPVVSTFENVSTTSIKVEQTSNFEEDNFIFVNNDFDHEDVEVEEANGNEGAGNNKTPVKKLKLSLNTDTSLTSTSKTVNKNNNKKTESQTLLSNNENSNKPNTSSNVVNVTLPVTKTSETNNQVLTKTSTSDVTQTTSISKKSSTLKRKRSEDESSTVTSSKQELKTKNNLTDTLSKTTSSKLTKLQLSSNSQANSKTSTSSNNLPSNNDSQNKTTSKSSQSSKVTSSKTSESSSSSRSSTTKSSPKRPLSSEKQPSSSSTTKTESSKNLSTFNSTKSDDSKKHSSSSITKNDKFSTSSATKSDSSEKLSSPISKSSSSKPSTSTERPTMSSTKSTDSKLNRQSQSSLSKTPDHETVSKSKAIQQSLNSTPAELQQIEVICSSSTSQTPSQRFTKTLLNEPSVTTFDYNSNSVSNCDAKKMKHIRVISIKCQNELCSRMFGNVIDHANHMLNYHQRLPFACLLADCTLAFQDKNKWLEHTISEHQQSLQIGQFYCRYCLQVFADQILLYSHFLFSHEKGEFDCAFCPHRGLYRVNVYSHIVAMHVEHEKVPKRPALLPFPLPLPSPSSSPLSSSSITLGPNNHPSSSSSFSAATDWRGGCKSSDFENDYSKAKNVKVFGVNCLICAREFPHEKWKIGHMAKEHKSLAIPCHVKDCGRSFKAQTHLKQHLDSNAHYRKPLLCAYCPENFFQVDDLLKHVSEHEMGRFKCEDTQCEQRKMMFTRAEVDAHYEEKHLQKFIVISVQCTEENCTAVCTTEQDLVVHFRDVHNRAAFKCVKCSNSYNSEEELANHAAKEHSKVRNCRYCKNWIATNETQLRKHFELSHSKGVIQCSYQGCFYKADYRDLVIAHYDEEHLQRSDISNIDQHHQSTRSLESYY